MVHRSLIAAAVLLLSLTSATAQITSMRPGKIRPISTGTADTASSNDFFGWISWKTAAGKTETLPTCNAGVNGAWITVLDGAGNGAAFPISVVPASGGTISGQPAGTGVQVASNYGSAMFVCDGTGNWAMTAIVASGPVVRSVSAANDTIASSDNGGLVTYTNSGGTNVILPQAGTAGFPKNAFSFAVQNYGGAAVAINPTTSTIANGANNLSVPAGTGAFIFADGAGNYQSILAGGTTPGGPGGPPGGGGGGSGFSATDHGADITISADTYTATMGAGSNWEAARGTQGYAAGAASKVVLVFLLKTAGAAGWIGGVANSSLSTGSYVGSAVGSAGIQGGNSTSTSTYIDGVTSSTVCGALSNSVFPAGSLMYWAVDFSSNPPHVWCSLDCQTWLGTGTPAPDTGTTPAFSLSNGYTYYPAWSGDYAQGGTYVAVLNTKPALGSCLHLSGFTTWN